MRLAARARVEDFQVSQIFLTATDRCDHCSTQSGQRYSRLPAGRRHVCNNKGSGVSDTTTRRL
jgi:hypothetical protein